MTHTRETERERERQAEIEREKIIKHLNILNTGDSWYFSLVSLVYRSLWNEKQCVIM